MACFYLKKFYSAKWYLEDDEQFGKMLLIVKCYICPFKLRFSKNIFLNHIEQKSFALWIMSEA